MSSHPATGNPVPMSDLRARWRALEAEEPGLRPRDIAKRLNVAEAQLVASRCGDGVSRLRGPWSELVRSLPSLGKVMVLTRNESVVHEKVGRFDNISVFQNMGMVLNEDVDLRIFFNHWYYGFSVTEETRGGTRRSLQFFDADGTAVHKVYLRVDSQERAFHRLAQEFRDVDQSATQSVLPRLRPPAELLDTFIDRVALRERWRALQDTHDFHAMLQELGVGRVQALRLVSEDAARLVGNDSFRVALQAAAEAEMSVMVFVGSPGGNPDSHRNGMHAAQSRPLVQRAGSRIQPALARGPDCELLGGEETDPGRSGDVSGDLRCKRPANRLALR